MSTELNEIRLGSTVHYRGRRLVLREDNVCLPNGVIGVREVVEHPRAVVIAPISPQNRLLMIRQFRTAAQRVLIEVPAGVIDADEEPLAAAQRELREETGFMAGKLEPLYEAFPTPGFCTEYMYFFKASELEYSPLSPDVDEIIQPFEVAFSEALDMIRTGRITDLKSIAAIYALATEGYL